MTSGMRATLLVASPSFAASTVSVASYSPAVGDEKVYQATAKVSVCSVPPWNEPVQVAFCVVTTAQVQPLGPLLKRMLRSCSGGGTSSVAVTFCAGSTPLVSMLKPASLGVSSSTPKLLPRLAATSTVTFEYTQV